MPLHGFPQACIVLGPWTQPHINRMHSSEDPGTPVAVLRAIGIALTVPLRVPLVAAAVLLAGATKLQLLKWAGCCERHARDEEESGNPHAGVVVVRGGRRGASAATTGREGDCRRCLEWAGSGNECCDGCSLPHPVTQ